MPESVFAVVSSRVSRLLHQLVYSFPTPNRTISAQSAADPSVGMQLPNAKHGAEDLLSEPGESRALAGGIGPLSFAGSGYGIMLVIMAILLNRITHIVRRPRPPPAPLPHPPTASMYHHVRRRVSRALVHPSTPRYLRLPGLFLLTRAWILFSVLTLQVANLWPLDSPHLFPASLKKAIDTFGSWAGDMSMQKVCWQVFLSVCAGLVCSGLANGLDRGRRRETGAGFNLFGYSFLLHLYSSPLTHHRPPPTATQGRPDIHALFQLWLSLTELTWLQAVDLSASPQKNILFPTAVCGTMGLIHFVYALSTSPLKFPSFTFLTHLMALFLSVIILLSIALKAFTHLFTLGYLPSPVFANLLPHEGVIPSVEDDFGVALLKLGTACIEATQYSGLRNELISIEERPGPWVELTSGGSEVRKNRNSVPGGFSAEVTDFEISSIEEPQQQSLYWREWRTFWHAVSVTMITFVWSVIMSTAFGRKTVSLVKEGWHSRWWYGPRQWRFWRRDAWREPPERRLRVARLKYKEALDKIEKKKEERQSRARSSALQSREEMPVPWREVLRGEVELEDDEEDWQDDSSSASSGSGGSDDEEDQREMYRELVADHTEDDLQPVLMAHFTNNSTPLTRRRYAAILSSPSHPTAPSALNHVIEDRRLATAGRERDEWDEDRKRCCVICTIEERSIILWPCRCLALCSDCRESLASRLPAKDHMCPCCRRKVDGYSRIYIP